MKKIILIATGLIILALGVFFIFGQEKEGLSFRIVSDEVNGNTNIKVETSVSGDQMRIYVSPYTFYYFAPNTFIYKHDFAARPYLFKSEFDEERFDGLNEAEKEIGMDLILGVSDFQTKFLPKKKLSGSFFWTQMVLRAYREGTLQNGENEFEERLLDRKVKAVIADLSVHKVDIERPQGTVNFRDLVAYEALINKKLLLFNSSEMQNGDDAQLSEIWSQYQDSDISQEELDNYQLQR